MAATTAQSRGQGHRRRILSWNRPVDPLAPNGQQRRHDHRPQKQSEQPEGSEASEDSDKGEKKRETRRAADQGWPDEVIAGKHDDRAPAKYGRGREPTA